MKKLMIATAAVALTVAAQAGIAVKTVNCYKASVVNSPCDEIVFKVTGSGKATDPFTKNYTTVSKLKVNGWLVLWPALQNPTDTDCCYPYYSLYFNAKIGKYAEDIIIAGADAEAVDAWSVFGKKLDDAETYTLASAAREQKKDKKFSLESQLGISGNWTTDNGYSAGTLVYADDVAAADSQPAIAFFATAFGKATWKVSNQAGCNKCDKPTYEGFEITPGSYSGWFAGVYEELLDAECLNCTCGFALFGGTWKAKYQTKVATWQAAVSNLFGAGVVADMLDEGIE
jgi:hypothetical protein